MICRFSIPISQVNACSILLCPPTSAIYFKKILMPLKRACEKTYKKFFLSEDHLAVKNCNNSNVKN